MFTGLVEGLGTIDSLVPHGPAIRLRVRPPAEILADCAIGDSIAINGCCLTVVRIDEGIWDFEAGEETLSRTNLGNLQVGDVVNLERSLPVGGRFGGHFVLGHVDAIGTVDHLDEDDGWVKMWFQIPARLHSQIVSKGSIAIDGVSLTVVDDEPERFSVALIPHTLDVTTLGRRQVGDHVNLETDMLGKYVEKLVRPAPSADSDH